MIDREPKPLDIKTIAISKLEGRALDLFAKTTQAIDVQTDGLQTLLRYPNLDLYLGPLPHATLPNGKRPTVFILDCSVVVFSITGDFTLVHPPTKDHEGNERVRILSVFRNKPLIVDQSANATTYLGDAAEIAKKEREAALAGR